MIVSPFLLRERMLSILLFENVDPVIAKMSASGIR